MKILTYIIISITFTQYSYAKDNDRVNDAKKLFETKKQEVIKKVKSGKLDSNEGKKIINNEREKIISDTKKTIKEEADRVKQEKNEKVKVLVKEKLSTKLEETNNENNKIQEGIYIKLIERLNQKSNENNINGNQKIIIDMMIEILENKKNNLK